MDSAIILLESLEAILLIVPNDPLLPAMLADVLISTDILGSSVLSLGDA